MSSTVFFCKNSITHVQLYSTSVFLKISGSNPCTFVCTKRDVPSGRPGEGHLRRRRCTAQPGHQRLAVPLPREAHLCFPFESGTCCTSLAAEYLPTHATQLCFALNWLPSPEHAVSGKAGGHTAIKGKPARWCTVDDRTSRQERTRWTPPESRFQEEGPGPPWPEGHSRSS